MVFDGKIWLIGGQDEDYKNDVWWSRDGVGWNLATANAPWAGRAMHTTVAFDNRIWVMGGRKDAESWWGTNFNDVWYSGDGINWTQATSAARWSKRFGLASETWDSKIWVMGGSPGVFHSNEVWCSTDGVKWVEVGKTPWSPRFSLASVIFQNKLWIMGGNEGGGRFTNDVWYMNSPPTQVHPRR